MDKTPHPPPSGGSRRAPEHNAGKLCALAPEGASVQAFGPHNQRYVQVPAAACAAPPRSPGARTLKGAAAPRSSDERLIVNPLMMHCRASHTVDMACIVQNLPRVLCPSGRKTAHRGAPGQCRGASGKTRLQAMMPSGKNPRRATTARQTHLLPQTTQCTKPTAPARSTRIRSLMP